MSRSAGRVLIIPKGDYDPTYQYEMLDSCEYNGSSYLCKQPSKGNLPTNKTYWQKLVEIGSNDYMAVDGHNADSVIFGGTNDASVYFLKFDISKAAGDNETITMTATVTQDNKANVIAEQTLDNQIGGEALINYQSSLKRIVIDSATAVSGTGSDTITVTAHLKQDDQAAMSASSVNVYLINYAGGDYSLIHGEGCNTNGLYNTVFGVNSSADGEFNFIAGRTCAIDGNGATSIGNNNYGVGATMAIGRGLQANTGGQIVVGKYNNNKSSNVFEVGGGTTSARSNVLEIKADGRFSTNDGTDFYKFAKSGGKDGFYDTNNDFHAFELPTRLVNSVTLSTSADVSTTFTDASITTDSDIFVLTSVFGINPKNIVTTNGSCTVTFGKVSSAQTISVKLKVE